MSNEASPRFPFPLVTCKKHGRSPGYCVCIHVTTGAVPAHILKATEKELGEALCEDCRKRGDLGVDDLVLWCAGCFADSQREP